MGKGDKKTKRGKIVNKSYGVRRPRKKPGKAYVPPVKPKEEKEEKKAPAKKAPAKKTAAKKTTAKKTTAKKTAAKKTTKTAKAEAGEEKAE